VPPEVPVSPTAAQAPRTPIVTARGTAAGHAATSAAPRPAPWILSVCAATIAVALWDVPLPRAVPATAPLTAFSSERAATHLTIARGPRPTGTGANRDAAAYIVNTLGTLGIASEIQEAAVSRAVGVNRFRLGYVRNVVARLRGTANRKALLLVSHYDSAIGSDGAADDASGVATLLETARALRAGAPLKNDVMFLFSDGEELRLLGARAFAEQHRWAADVGAVVNLEARGAKGRSRLFETGREADGLVAEFLAVARDPAASSLASVLYRWMPHDTDLSVFKARGLPGLNFAFAEDWPAYHAALDRVDRLDQRSLQHHGNHVLALAERLGQADLANVPDRRLVYFNLLGSFVVSYSARLAAPLAFVACLAVLAALVWGLRRRVLKIPGVLVGVFIAVPLSLAIALFTTRSLLFRVIGDPRTGEAVLYQYPYLDFAILTLSLLIGIAVVTILSRWTSSANLAMGALIWWAVLALPIALRMPEASYAFVFPLVGGIVAFIAGIGGTPIGSLPARRLALLLAATVVTLLVVVPIVEMAFTAFIGPMAWIASAFVVLTASLFVPQIALLGASQRWLPTAALAMATITAGAIAQVGARFDVNQRKSNLLLYIADADRGTAVWASGMRALDSWTARYFPTDNGGALKLAEHVPGWYRSWLLWDYPGYVAIAPQLNLGVPAVTLLDRRAKGSEVRSSLTLQSQRHAPEMTVRFHVPGGIRSLVVDGATLHTAGASPPPEDVFVQMFGEPAGGHRAELVGVTQRLTVDVVERSYELPPAAQVGLPARPDWMMPVRSLGDGTLVVRSIALPPTER
jgi:hypothetical protein